MAFEKLKANWADFNKNAPAGTKFQVGLGAAQGIMGLFTNLGSRPKMPIPRAVQEATSIARQQAMATTRPGNEYAISQINRAQGQSINALNRSLGSGSQILAGVSQINQNTNRALAENANQNTLFKFNATQNLQNSLARLGQYQQQQWKTNELDPYMTKAGVKSSLIGAGLQNISQGLNTMSEMSLYDKVFGTQEQSADNKFFGVNNNPSFANPMAPKIGGGKFFQPKRWNVPSYGDQSVKGILGY